MKHKPDKRLFFSKILFHLRKSVFYNGFEMQLFGLLPHVVWGQEVIASFFRDKLKHTKNRNRRLFNPEDGGNIFLLNVGFSQNYTALQTRGQSSSFLY
jgi:hypothetical protein